MLQFNFYLIKFPALYSHFYELKNNQRKYIFYYTYGNNQACQMLPYDIFSKKQYM